MPPAKTTPPTILADLVETLCRGLPAAQLLVASDFDGTLAPIVAAPDQARALPASLAALARLQELGVHVAVISGRATGRLREAVPVPGVTLLGDYGLEAPDAAERAALAEFNARAAEEFGGLEGVVIEAKPGSTSVHFRDNPAAGPCVFSCLAPVAAELGLRASEGRRVVEVRPRGADKGLALQRLLDRLRPHAVVFAGDDEGDRSAFERAATSGLKHLAVGVGSSEVAPDLFERCDAVVAGPEAWAELLGAIARRLG